MQKGAEEFNNSVDLGTFSRDERHSANGEVMPCIIIDGRSESRIIGPLKDASKNTRFDGDSNYDDTLAQAWAVGSGRMQDHAVAQ